MLRTAAEKTSTLSRRLARSRRRMTPIRTGVELVIRADRNVDFFFEVPVHVAEPQVVRAVLVDVESLVYRRDALAAATVREILPAIREVLLLQ